MARAQHSSASCRIILRNLMQVPGVGVGGTFSVIEYLGASIQQLKYFFSNLMAIQLILDHSRETVSCKLCVFIYALVSVGTFYLPIEREAVSLRHSYLKLLVLDFKEKQHQSHCLTPCLWIPHFKYTDPSKMGGLQRDIVHVSISRSQFGAVGGRKYFFPPNWPSASMKWTE